MASGIGRVESDQLGQVDLDLLGHGLRPVRVEGAEDDVRDVFVSVKRRERRPGDEGAVLVALAVVVGVLELLPHHPDDGEGDLVDEDRLSDDVEPVKEVLGQDVADHADALPPGHVLGIDEPARFGDGVAHPLESGIDPADRVPELLPAVADQTAADELGADDLDPGDLVGDRFDHLRGDADGLAFEESLPGERRPGREHEDDPLPHAVEPLGLGLPDRIAESEEEDDGERPPDDAGKGQGRPERLPDEVPDEVPEENADHRIT